MKMYKNYKKEPKSPELNHTNHQPMVEYHTKPNLARQMQQYKQENKRFPTEKEYETLVAQTLVKMNKIWLEFYTDYAALCDTTLTELDGPTKLEICNQFGNYLTLNQVSTNIWDDPGRWDAEIRKRQANSHQSNRGRGRGYSRGGYQGSDNNRNGNNFNKNNQQSNFVESSSWRSEGRKDGNSAEVVPANNDDDWD